MHAASGGFFDVDAPEPAPEPEMPPQPPWMQPPADVLPGRVVLDDVLHRDDRAVLLLREVRAYATGLQLVLAWTRRRHGESAREWERWIQDAVRFHPGGADRDDLLLGVRLGDGTRVLPIPLQRAWRPDAEISPPTLCMLGGSSGSGGGPDRYGGEVEAWLWTDRPVEGDLDVVAEWRTLGVPEVSHRISADVLASLPAPRPLWD